MTINKDEMRSMSVSVHECCDEKASTVHYSIYIFLFVSLLRLAREETVFTKLLTK